MDCKAKKYLHIYDWNYWWGYYRCGKTPMLPRYALGNWWSRYYKYSEESYMELMDKFDEKNIPFTVADNDDAGGHG